jgi:hypothetical protein
MNLKHHPLSPYKITEEQAYIAVTSGYRWVPALSPDSQQVRTLVADQGLNCRMGMADPESPIYLFNPIDF